MKKIITFITLFLFLFNTASAQENLDLFENWHEYLNIPEEFSTFPEIIYLVLIPFLAVMAIIFGVLTFIFKDLFDKRVKLILALVFASSLLYLGPLIAVVSTLLQFTSVFSVVVFFVLVFFLMAVQIFRKTVGGYGETKKLYTQVKGYQKSISNIDDDVKGLIKNRDDLQEKRQKLTDNIAEINQRIFDLEETEIEIGSVSWGKSELKGELRKNREKRDELQKSKGHIMDEMNKINDRIDTLRKRKRELKLDIK